MLSLSMVTFFARPRSSGFTFSSLIPRSSVMALPLVALQKATSIAALMLTTEALVADIKEEGAKAAAVGGGMGGTY